jgi:putative ABC transport system permease protein
MPVKKSSPPLLPRLLIRLALGGEELQEFDSDLMEIYQQMTAGESILKAKIWYSFRVFESIPGLVLDNIKWRSTMITNYLKIALRNFRRHKGYSFINIAGFAMGMACCMLILIYVRQELSYDRYQKDVDRIYRVAIDIRTQTANRVFAPITPMAGPTLKADFPQVAQTARVLTAQGRLVKRDEVFFYEDLFMYSDPELFDVLTIPFIEGDPKSALSQPLSLVLTQRMANKYFGRVDPLGKMLTINQKDYKITGILENPPENTHLKYDLIASMTTLADWGEMTNWHSTMFYTYVKLMPHVNGKEFSASISNLADKYIKDRLLESGKEYYFFLQPITGIHLHSNIRYEVEPPGNPDYIYILSLVGSIILLIAVLNFMNLTTARAAKRSNEVGMRKVVGAQRRQLIGQFLGESLLVALVSLGFALILARMTAPFLNKLLGTSLAYQILLAPGILGILLTSGICVGLAAGLYPAFLLSRFKPITTLKRTTSAGPGGSGLRSALVVLQFSVSVALIIGTLTMYQQFNFMKDQHLGFEKEQKLILPIRGGISIEENFETVKEVFSKHPSITTASASSSVPGRGVSNYSTRLVGEEDEQSQSMFHLYFDHNFIPNYGIEIVAGRAFQKEMSTDIAGAFLLNEAAVKAYGWNQPEEAIGKKIQTGRGGRVNPVIGITKDFHYQGLQKKVEPLVMEYLPEVFRVITLSLEISDLSTTLAFVESQWDTLFPGNPFEHFFLDTDFNQQYRSDEQVGRIFAIFTYLGLFIACLGLLGLASFTAEIRTKEIGIRKVLGASVGGIVIMLSKQFTRWVLVANLIAWPLAYLFMNQWLENFAYRTSVNIWTYILSGGLALLIALVIVSYQCIRAATANPVDSLRYE